MNPLLNMLFGGMGGPMMGANPLMNMLFGAMNPMGGMRNNMAPQMNNMQGQNPLMNIMMNLFPFMHQ